jgi:hypothetical protein
VLIVQAFLYIAIHVIPVIIDQKDLSTDLPKQQGDAV